MSDIPTIAKMIRTAERHSNDLAVDRVKALEYINGIMLDTPRETGRSGVVSRDVREQIKKALPSIVRTMLGNDNVVEYLPVNEGDEEGAQQATDYINSVVLPGDGLSAIEDAIHDALRHKNGILRWWWEQERCVKFSRHTGLPDDAFAVLVGDDSVEVLEHTERQEMTDMGPLTVHDCRIKRVETESEIEIAAVPHERFLIDPDATCVEDATVVGERTEISRSELIEMGYDRKLVEQLSDETEDDYERGVRRQNYTNTDADSDPANSSVDYYDLYIRTDLDDDGIAELRHMVFAGGLGEKNLLVNEEVDDVQFCTVRVMREPHQWEGVSVSEDVMDIQRINTVLLRQTLDNIYWQNNLQPTIQEGAIKNEEAVFNPEFGKPIVMKAGIPLSEGIQYNPVPFVAGQSFAMIDYFKKAAQDRTGISDASGGLPAEALQNMTATASAMVEQTGIGQVELMVRTLARDIKPFFRGLLRCITRHMDVPTTVRLRGKWVRFDPRDWNADMDCSVNVGLGAGTRERDMQVMQQVIGLQQQIFAAFGPDNPFVTADNLHNAAKRLLEAAGLKSPDLYISEPNPQEVQAKLDAMRNAPSPEQQKAQMQMQVEQAKLAANRDKEKAQMEADLIVSQRNNEAQMAIEDKRIAWEREKLMRQQAADLAVAGLGHDHNGMPVNPAHEAMIQANAAVHQSLQHTNNMLALMAQHMATSSMPKRVIRDANGEIVGLEPVPPQTGMMN